MCFFERRPSGGHLNRWWIEDLTWTPSTIPASLFQVISVKTVAMNDDTYLFFFSVKDGCIQRAHIRIKDFEQLQKLCQSVCQNHAGRPGALYIQLGPENKICLLMGEKRAWFDKITAQSCWLAWLWLHLHAPCEKLALNPCFCELCFSLGGAEPLSPLWGTSHLGGTGPAPAARLALSCSLR